MQSVAAQNFVRLAGFARSRLGLASYRWKTAGLRMWGRWIAAVQEPLLLWLYRRAAANPLKFQQPLPVIQLEPYLECPVNAGPRPIVHCDVVIACHPPHLKFLAESVDSILNQAFACCHVHVAFDGEFPGQDEFRASYAGYERLYFYRSRRPVGQFKLANWTFPHLRTDFIAVQDADDLSMPNRIWRSVTLLQEKNADIFGGCREQFVDHRHASPFLYEKLQAHPFHQSGLSTAMTPQGSIAHGAMVIRKSAFAELNGYSDLLAAADTDLAFRAQFSGLRIYHSSQIVSLRRLNEVSDTGAYDQWSQDEIRRRKVEFRAIQDLLRDRSLSSRSVGSLQKHLSANELLILGPAERRST